jgi:hypothetical protein
MMDDWSREEVSEAVDRAVAELLQAAGVVEPPVDAILLARSHLGIEVCRDNRQHNRGRAQRAGGKKLIYIREEPREERDQWTVAHEIGELLKSDLLHRLGIEPGQVRPMSGESLANLFAHRLLVPTQWLRAEAAACAFDLLALKKRLATASHEVLAWRLLDLPNPCIISIVDNGHVYRRRSNAWPVRRELTPVEQECQRYVNHFSRPHVIQREGWTVQGWPVHQPDWKREILRSVVEMVE